MFSQNFFERIKTHNQTINIINSIIRDLEKDVISYVKTHPDVCLYFYDTTVIDTYTFFDLSYPQIHFTLYPFRTTLYYKDIIKQLNGEEISHSNTKKIIEELIIKSISFS